MKNMRRFALWLAAAGLASALSFSAMAASGDDEEDEAISGVTLEIDVDVEAGDEETNIEVDTDSDEYSVLDVIVSNEPGLGEVWEYRERPKLKITLDAEDGYYFESGFGKDSVSISGSEGTVTTAKRSSKSRLVVNVTMEAIEGGEGDLDVENLVWDKTRGVAEWTSAGYAKYYEVQLYGGGRSLGSVLTTTDTRYNFSNSISDSNSYTFRVRAVRSNYNKGDWEESDIWHVSGADLQNFTGANYSAGAAPGSSAGMAPGSSAGVVPGNLPAGTQNGSPAAAPGAGMGTGAWLQDAVGWWYCNPDKSYTINDWQLIDGRWYFFDAAGYRKTGWVAWNAKWYFLGADGAMLANTTTPDGRYVGSDGAWMK